LFSHDEEGKMISQNSLIYTIGAVLLAAFLTTPAVAQEKKAAKAKA